MTISQSRAHNTGKDELLHSLSSFSGVTTADGNAGGTTLICAALIGSNDFITGKTVIIESGGALYEDAAATLFNNVTGQITIGPAFSTQIISNTAFFILNSSSSAAFGAALAALLAILGPADTSILGSLYAILGNPATSISTQIANIKFPLAFQGTVTAVPGANQFTIPSLAGMGANAFIDLSGVNPYSAFVFRDGGGGGAAPQGESRTVTGYATLTGNFSANAFTVPVGIGDEVLIIHPFLARILNLYGGPPATGNLAANWNTGVATSGNAGADLVTLGAANVKDKVHALFVDISALTVGATIRVRLFMFVNGVERQVYNQTFLQGTDPDGLWIINGSLAIHEALRVEVSSNNVLDDGLVVAYDYLLEPM